MESPSLRMFKERLDMMLGDVIQWVTLVVGGWLDQMNSEVFSNLMTLFYSMILYLKHDFTAGRTSGTFNIC